MPKFNEMKNEHFRWGDIDDSFDKCDSVDFYLFFTITFDLM